MPKYRVRDRVTRREIILEGDGPPPTEQEIEEAFASLRPAEESSLSLGKMADVAIPTALRVGGAIAGATVGGAGGSILPGAGTAAGVAAGGAGGGAVGEFLAEVYEKARGVREEINATQVATQAALSAIPGGRAASLVRRVGQTAALGAAGTAATELAEGRTPQVRDVAVGAVVGGSLGAIPPRRPVLKISGKVPVPQTPALKGFKAYTQADTEIQNALGRGRVIVGDPTQVVPPARAMGPRQKTDGIQLQSFPEPIREPLRKVLQQHDGFESQRRGIQPWERTAALSQRIALDLKTALPKGKVLNAEEQGAYGNALTSITSKLDELLNRNPSSLTDLDRLKIEELRASQLVAMQSLWGTVSETGRALNYWKSIKAVMESHDEKFIRQALDALGGDMEKVTAKLRELKDPIARYEWLKANQHLGIGEAVRTYVYANMLSGIRTHERNFVGNTSRLLFDLAADVASGRPRQATHKTLGMIAAIPRASKEFAFQMRHGFAREAAESSQFDKIYAELPGGGKNPFNDVLRLLSASDTFTKILIKNGELYRKAHSEALKEGKRGAALVARATELRATPPSEWIQEAERIATNTVFQDRLGPFSLNIQKAVNSVPGGFLVMPFVKIASNLTKAGVEASPVGLFKGLKLPPGRERDLVMARARLGSALLTPIVWLAAQGQITGSGPEDPAKKSLLMQTGWRPNSIRIGDDWVDYSTWAPMALPMMAAANWVEGARELSGKDAALTELASQLILRTADSILNMSFLQGLSNLYDALSERESISVNRLIAGHVQQFVPFGGALRTATQVVDPIIRTPEGPVEAVESIVPGMSNQVQPLLDPYGRPTRRVGNPLLGGIVSRSPVVGDPVSDLLLGLDVPLARPSKRLEDEKGEGIQLSPREATALAMARGVTRRENLERVVQRATRARDVDRARDMLEKAKSSGISDITRRARLMKRRGQTLEPRRLVNQRVVDRLYEQYRSER